MRWNDGVAAFSLANLVYLRVWAEVLTLNGESLYWLQTPPTPAHFMALMVNVCLLGVVLLCWITGLRHRRAFAFWVLPVAGLLIIIAIVNSLRVLGVPGVSMFLRLATDRLPMLGVAVGILMVLALTVWGLRAVRPVYTVLLILSPLVVLFVGQAFYRLHKFDASSTTDGPMAGGLPTKPTNAPRVVWVIFDEWDQELSFEDRPSHIRLPEIDRLSATAFSATNAESPGPFTDRSMPALITGMALADARVKSASELMIRSKDDDRWIPWSRQDNVFRRAREMGFNTAVVGWAVPYCRVLRADLSDCWWWSGSNHFNSSGRTIPELLVGQPRSLFETEYRSPFGQSLSTKRHMWVHERVLAQALKVVGDPQYGLVLIHLPVPHPPYFFSSATGRNDWGNTPFTGILKQTQQGYLHALVLTDQTVGILRRAMEQAGVWKGTTVIWSSDHPFRHRRALDGKSVSHRVPYLIKPAGVGQAVRYERPFSALMTRKLIEAFLSREIAHGGQVADWIDQHRTRLP